MSINQTRSLAFVWATNLVRAFVVDAKRDCILTILRAEVNRNVMSVSDVMRDSGTKVLLESRNFSFGVPYCRIKTLEVGCIVLPLFIN